MIADRTAGPVPSCFLEMSYAGSLNFHSCGTSVSFRA